MYPCNWSATLSAAVRTPGLRQGACTFTEYDVVETSSKRRRTDGATSISSVAATAVNGRIVPGITSI